jgi:hypothetical protein
MHTKPCPRQLQTLSRDDQTHTLRTVHFELTQPSKLQQQQQLLLREESSLYTAPALGP